MVQTPRGVVGSLDLLVRLGPPPVDPAAASCDEAAHPRSVKCGAQALFNGDRSRRPGVEKLATQTRDAAKRTRSIRQLTDRVPQCRA